MPMTISPRRRPLTPTQARVERRAVPWLLAALAVCAGGAQAQTVQLAKVSTGGTGTFEFALGNLDNPADSITTIAPGVASTSPLVSTVSSVGAAVTLTETPGASFTLSGASCVDTSGTLPGSIGVRLGNTLTIAASNLLPGVSLLCTFENTQLDIDVSLDKQVTPTVVASGGSVEYTLTAANVGAVDVVDAVLSDTPGAGLSCTSAGTCVPSGGATCPGSVPASALFGAGVTLPSLPVGSSVAVTVACTVTATGQ